MYKILVADDDADIAHSLEIYLRAEGYAVALASNGKEAVDTVEADPSIALVLMDVMMPVMDGIAATVALRDVSNVPVIMLTAKGEDSDKVLGLNLGADDYIVKPFSPVEVIARVRSQLRRYTSLGASPDLGGRTLKCGGIELDDDRKSVTLDGAAVSLTPTEYEILKLLISNPGKVFSTAQIYRAVWKGGTVGSGEAGDGGAVAVHIRHLREKLEYDPANPRYLKVVWGQGYKLEDEKPSNGRK